MFAAAWLNGVNPLAAAVIGFGLALSSTALVLQVLASALESARQLEQLFEADVTQAAESVQAKART